LGTAFAVLIVLLVGIGQLGLRRMHEIDDILRNIAGAIRISRFAADSGNGEYPKPSVHLDACGSRTQSRMHILKSRNTY
jgi:hypothetical protein